MKRHRTRRLQVESLETRTAPTVVPVGGEFRANTYTTDSQYFSRTAMDTAGDFVIVWESRDQDGSNYGVYAQRYSAAGAPQGPEFRVNTYTSGDQWYPSVAMDGDGDFIVAWQSNLQDSGTHGVYAQAYHADGGPDGGEYRVNTFTTGNQSYPAVGMDGDGDFAVAWQSNGQDGDGYGVYAQRYSLVQATGVIGVQVNGGASQRSRVTELTVTFSTQVTFDTTPTAAFTLTRNSDSANVNFMATWNVVSGVTVVTLNNFSGLATDFSSLADGRYTLTALASQISASDQPLDGNGDGTGGGDYVLVGSPTNGLFRLFGDADGNGVINNADFLAFRSAFGGTSFAFDFDGNGSVGSSDFLAFRSRFGSSV